MEESKVRQKVMDKNRTFNAVCTVYHGNELYFDITFETAWQRPVDVLECRCFAKREKVIISSKIEEFEFSKFLPHAKILQIVFVTQLFFLLNSPSSKSNLDL